MTASDKTLIIIRDHALFLIPNQIDASINVSHLPAKRGEESEMENRNERRQMRKCWKEKREVTCKGGLSHGDGYECVDSTRVRRSGAVREARVRRRGSAPGNLRRAFSIQSLCSAALWRHWKSLLSAHLIGEVRCSDINPCDEHETNNLTSENAASTLVHTMASGPIHLS